MTDTFTGLLDWLYQLRGKQIKLGLEPTRKLLLETGLENLPFPVIHVAGTNGKGTTVYLIQRILMAHGLRTGLYTSPHIERFNERIRIDDTLIPDEAIEDYLRVNRDRVVRLETTFFETTTAMALAWFAGQKVDVAVVETGLGGRFDATNAVSAAVHGITRIDYDHMEFLGNTLIAIAREKMGITRAGTPAFSLYQEPEVIRFMQRYAAIQGTLLSFIDPHEITISPAGTEFECFGRRWQLPIPGRHFAANACLALAMTRKYLGEKFSDEKAAKALELSHWPGRMEIIDSEIPVVIDAAHNPGGIKALVDTLGELWPGKKWRILIGMMRDKSIDEAVRLLAPGARSAVCLPFDYHRAMGASELAELFRREGVSADVYNSKPIPLAEGDEGILVCGSHFIIARARRVIAGLKKTVQNP